MGAAYFAAPFFQYFAGYAALSVAAPATAVDLRIQLETILGVVDVGYFAARYFGDGVD